MIRELTPWTQLTRNGIPQREFAAIIGVKQATVSRYASGHRIPTLKILFRIKLATRGVVTFEDFLTE